MISGVVMWHYYLCSHVIPLHTVGCSCSLKCPVITQSSLLSTQSLTPYIRCNVKWDLVSGLYCGVCNDRLEVCTVLIETGGFVLPCKPVQKFFHLGEEYEIDLFISIFPVSFRSNQGFSWTVT